MIFSFKNDYGEGCLPDILNTLNEFNLEQTSGYGLDRFCQQAKELIKKKIRKDYADIHFVVGGTQANLLVISSYLRPHEGVVCVDSGHINVHETGAIEATGHKVMPIASKNGKLDPEKLEAFLVARKNDDNAEHMVKPGMVYISQPTELGTLYYKDELSLIKDICHSYDLPLFIDGARLAMAVTSEINDVTFNDMANLCDCFTIGGTKCGALFGEAIVFPSVNGIPEFRYMMKQKGAMLAKGRLLGMQFGRLFSNDLYEIAGSHANEMAMLLRKGLEEQGFDFFVKSHTNQIFPILPTKAVNVLIDDFPCEIWQDLGDGRSAVRFVCSWSTPPEAVEALLKTIKNLTAE